MKLIAKFLCLIPFCYLGGYMIGPCSLFGHRQFYDCKNDDIFCTKCNEKWASDGYAKKD